MPVLLTIPIEWSWIVVCCCNLIYFPCLPPGGVPIVTEALMADTGLPFVPQLLRPTRHNPSKLHSHAQNVSWKMFKMVECLWTSYWKFWLILKTSFGNFWLILETSLWKFCLIFKNVNVLKSFFIFKNIYLLSDRFYPNF